MTLGFFHNGESAGNGSSSKTSSNAPPIDLLSNASNKAYVSITLPLPTLHTIASSFINENSSWLNIWNVALVAGKEVII